MVRVAGGDRDVIIQIIDRFPAFLAGHIVIKRVTIRRNALRVCFCIDRRVATIHSGAPATLIRALCGSYHIVAGGGGTGRNFTYGGTHGGPTDPSALRALIATGRRAAVAEEGSLLGDRARRKRLVFDRKAELGPLRGWVESLARRPRPS